MFVIWIIILNVLYKNIGKLNGESTTTKNWKNILTSKWIDIYFEVS